MSEPPRGGRTKRVIAPKGPGRRSQTERAQREQDERERTRLRDEEYTKEMRAQEAAQKRADRWKQQRSQNRRGRGGFMGDPLSLRAGPLSAASAAASSRARAFPRPWAPSRRGRTGNAKTFGPVKREGEDSHAEAPTTEPDSRSASDGEEDDDGEGPRIDIDQIDFIVVSSDDEEAEDGGKSRQSFSWAPVRVDRVEHSDRKPQLNVDGMTIKKQENDEVDLNSIPISANKKGKQRSKDVEIIGAQERWRPVYDEDDDEVRVIKREEATSAPIPSTSAPTEQVSEAAQVDLDEPTRPRIRKRVQPENLVFQTREEREEYDRHQTGLQTVVDELGQMHLNEAPREENTEGGDQQPQVDQKADRVYVFQFPPVVPDLSDANKEATDTSDPVVVGATSMPDKPAVEGQVVEETAVKDDPERSKADMSSDKAKHLPTLEAGWVGKLKVHQSGKARLDWGGSPFQLQMGITPFFLQDVVMTRLNKEAREQAQRSTTGPKKDVDAIAGEAMAFGQVRGKFVVTPEWDELLGKM